MTHHLAELNVGRLVAPPGDPRVAEFMDNLERIKALAERMPGYVWRLETGAGNATALAARDDPCLIPNLSVWEGVEALEAFVWGTLHRRFYERREEWFAAMTSMRFVMWRVPEGHRPTLAEARGRLAHREAHGDTDEAFGWPHLREARLWRDRGCVRAA